RRGEGGKTKENKEEGVGREVQICTAGLSGRRGNASRACWRESLQGLAPPKTTSHLNPFPHCPWPPRVNPLPSFHPTPLPTWPTQTESILCIYNFFFFAATFWGVFSRKKLAQLHTCTDCTTVKLQDSMIRIHIHTGTEIQPEQSLFRPELTGRHCLSFIHSARVCGDLY
uniref:Uncharacterized protein n=1 Tax=Sus scrofa TaxID=9823 RepID=A0A5G2QB93_PIG